MCLLIAPHPLLQAHGTRAACPPQVAGGAADTLSLGSRQSQPAPFMSSSGTCFCGAGGLADLPSAHARRAHGTPEGL